MQAPRLGLVPCLMSPVWPLEPQPRESLSTRVETPSSVVSGCPFINEASNALMPCWMTFRRKCLCLLVCGRSLRPEELMLFRVWSSYRTGLATCAPIATMLRQSIWRLQENGQLSGTTTTRLTPRESLHDLTSHLRDILAITTIDTQRGLCWWKTVILQWEGPSFWAESGLEAFVSLWMRFQNWCRAMSGSCTPWKDGRSATTWAIVSSDETSWFIVTYIWSQKLWSFVRSV